MGPGNRRCSRSSAASPSRRAAVSSSAAASGSTNDVVNQYLAEGAGRILPGVPVETLRINPRGGNLEAIFTHLTVREQPRPDAPMTIDLQIEARRPVRFNSLSVNLCDR